MPKSKQNEITFVWLAEILVVIGWPMKYNFEAPPR